MPSETELLQNEEGEFLSNGVLVPRSQVEAEYENLTVMTKAKRFNSWTYDLISPFLGKEILEVGSGFGTFTEKMLGEERKVLGLDVNSVHMEYARKRCPDAEFVLHDLASGLGPLAGRQFDTMVSMNVLEHIKDDFMVMQNVVHLLKTGGKAVVLVPAHPIIYDELDRMSGHYRRYTKESAKKLMTEAGLRIAEVKWFNPWSLPILFLKSRVQKADRLTTSSVKAYDLMVPVFRALENFIPPLIGQSILVIGEKK